MDVLARLLTGGLQASGTPGPADDFWYSAAGTMTAAGIRVDEDGAKKISAWFRGRDLLSTALAMLPLHLYQRLPDDGGATPATDQPLYDALHRKPHTDLLEDSFMWRRQAMMDLIDTGWAIDRVDVGARWGLRRIDPRVVTPERLKSGPAAGRWLFHVRDESTAQTTTYTQDEVFVRKLADGKGILEHARESLGLARITENYASKVFGSGALAAGLIKVPGPMDDDSARAMAQSFKTAAGDWHMPKVLPNGADYIPQDTLTPEKAQMLLSRKFSINDIARWLGIPPHMLMDLDRATFSNIEHQGQEFVTYYLGPWLSLWEFAINTQLVLDPARYYAEFTRDALVRGDIAARWQAYQIQIQTGTFTRNEVRRRENANKLPGLDTPLEPAHLTGSNAAERPPAASAPPRGGARPASTTDSRAFAIAQASAARLLRKEVRRVQALAVRHAADLDAFAGAVTEFYQEHAALVAAELLLADAAGYCAGQAAQIVGGNWVEAIRLWDTAEYAAGLAALALEQEAAA